MIEILKRFFFHFEVTNQGLPCTPQSQTSPLPPPPRTGEQPGQSATLQTFSASRGYPDLWTWESSSVVQLLHWTHRLRMGLLYVKKNNNKNSQHYQDGPVGVNFCCLVSYYTGTSRNKCYFLLCDVFLHIWFVLLQSDPILTVYNKHTVAYSWLTMIGKVLYACTVCIVFFSNLHRHKHVWMCSLPFWKYWSHADQ